MEPKMVSDTRAPAKCITNVLGHMEIVPEGWDDEVTEVKKIDHTLRLILDSCALKPRKTVPEMQAVLSADEAFG